VGVLTACSSSDTTATTAPSTAAAVTTAVPDTTVAPPATEALPALDTVEGLAAELSAVEAGIRAAGVTVDELAELGRRQQIAYRTMNRHEEWHARLLELVSPEALAPVQFHLDAWAAWDAHSEGRTPTPPPDVLPAWTVVEPLPADELLAHYREAEALTGVPWQYLAAIHFQETRMGRIVGVSSAGAVGPMQFLPTTWAECCEGDPTLARDAIIGAAVYLVDRGAPADMRAALYGYNPNDGYVGAVTAYAKNLMADDRAYLGYHGWQVFVGTSAGTVRLPVGYSATEPVDVDAYLADHPDDLVVVP
jgi:membrane-bound lytic murein transglycosylase B